VILILKKENKTIDSQACEHYVLAAQEPGQFGGGTSVAHSR